MILSPLPNLRAKLIRVSVMYADGTEDGDSSPTVVYAVSPLPALRAIKRDGGSAVAIKTGGTFKWVSMNHRGRTIYPTGNLSPDAVLAWRDYCYSRGITARSLQGMGFYLMRQTLAGRMFLDEGEVMPMGIFPASAHLYAKEGVYTDIYQSDIRAAYLSALINFDPVREYVRTGRVSIREAMNFDPGSFVLCRYRVGNRYLGDRFPVVAYNGAPVRRWGNDRLLSVNDFRLLVTLGWDCRIREAWVPAKSYVRPFSEFGGLIRELRAHPIIGPVAKLSSNTVWGSFMAGSKVHRLDFSGGGEQPRSTLLPPRSKLCQPLAFSIIAALRERICLEGMGEATIQAHTDGILSPFPLSTGDDIGDWRTVGKFDRVDVVRPGCYALTRDGHTTYRVSGHSGSDERYRQLFRERMERYGHAGTQAAGGIVADRGR